MLLGSFHCDTQQIICSADFTEGSTNKEPPATCAGYGIMML